MNSRPDPARIGLLLSGGLDSSVLLGHLLGQGRCVQPFYVRSDLAWQSAELAAAKGFLRALASPNLADLVVLDLPLRDVYGEHWSVTGRGVPDLSSPDEAVYLPGRNALLTIKPVIWCQMHGIEELALAVLGNNPFSDATAEFFHEFQAALQRASGRLVRIVRPFARWDKYQVMELGRSLPLERTFSCISPVDGRHCGVCNKCAERMAAFGQLGAADPTVYADTTATLG